MRNKKGISKILTISGTVLVWAPVSLTLLTSLAGTLAERALRFDYLMPAELSPLALGGALLLLWASLRARLYRKSIVIGVSAAFGCLIGGQAVTVASGLASGTVAPAGLPLAAVMASIAVYSLSTVGLGVAGIMLAKKLFGEHETPD
jgi:hypothetical protein